MADDQISKREQMFLLLKKAGWYPNRRIDISAFELQCEENEIELFDSARAFLEEYMGIEHTVYFTAMHPLKEIGECLHDYNFFFISSPLDKASCEIDYRSIVDYAKEDCYYVGTSGYYYPAVVAVGRSGKIYLKHDYSKQVLEFHDLIESMEWELRGKDIVTSSLYK